jgi:hypothetical protein
MLPFVLMAQLNSEKFSQGCPSLQYSGSPAKACLAARSFFLQIFQLPAMKDVRVMVTRAGSAQADFRAAQECLPRIASAEISMRHAKTVLLPSCSQKNFAETRAIDYRAGGALSRSRMMTEVASAAFVAKTSDTPQWGVLGV